MNAFPLHGPEPMNELDVELQVRGIVLRSFAFGLFPLSSSLRPDRGGLELDGLELRAVARDTGLQVSLRFERSEFVNIATAGLGMLDAADAIEGGDNG